MATPERPDDLNLVRRVIDQKCNFVSVGFRYTWNAIVKVLRSEEGGKRRDEPGKENLELKNCIALVVI